MRAIVSLLPAFCHVHRAWAFPASLDSPSYGSESQRADAVKNTFEIAWNGYYKYAFPNDELLPVTNGVANTFGGWGASAVDALSTAIVMGEQSIVQKILKFIPTIDWTKTYQDESISLFETNIRYIGGMLSAYDLLKGPASSLVTDDSLVDALLDQASNLANNLSYAFNTPSGIPYNILYPGNQSTNDATTNGLATIGTLVLEWTRLSDLTGNDTYTTLTQKAESFLLEPKPSSSEPFPGLVGTYVNISNGVFLDAEGGWNGGDDSFYEYLLKVWIYDQSRFGRYKDRWVLAADSSMQYLGSHPSSRPDLTFLASFNGTKIIEQSQHLACFAGGNFILGGQVLGEQKYIDFGLALVDGCEDTYNQTLTGIGPDTFGWDDSNMAAGQEEFFEKAGFYITGPNYILRPEVIESFYYAYRATGDPTYQEWAWNAFVAINATTKAGSGYSEISNVNAANGGSDLNFQDSFFFAEVLKYSYLIHAGDAEYQVSQSGKNKFVFNTEAHPLKVKSS